MLIEFGMSSARNKMKEDSSEWVHRPAVNNSRKRSLGEEPEPRREPKTGREKTQISGPPSPLHEPLGAQTHMKGVLQGWEIKDRLNQVEIH